MAIVFLKDSTLTNIANAIRGKLGTTETMLPSEMAGMIETITGGGGESLPEKSGIVELKCVKTITGLPDGKFFMCGLNAERAIYAENTEIQVGMNNTDLGDAPATSFEVGKTATSMYGRLLKGKLVTDSVKTQEGGTINLNWAVGPDGYRRATLAEAITGGEHLPVKEGQIVLGLEANLGIDNNGFLLVRALNDERAIYALDSEVVIKQDASVLGNAPDFGIAAGVTASSIDGIAMQGKLVIESVKTQAGESIGLNWQEEADGYFRATLAESISMPSYNLQIMTTNPGDGSDSIVYYAPGSTEKTNITLTGEYQSITCGDFIALYRGSANNVTTLIYFRDNADSNVTSIGVTDKYAVGLTPHGSWSVINIGAIMKDFPAIKKIRIGYSAG